jgi:histidinol-phosphate aminotransferase
MRVGYGVANQNIINALYKMRPPFNISSLSLAAAIEASRAQQFVEDSIALHQEQIKRYENFAKEQNIDYIESYTNFVTYLFDEGRSASEIAEYLLRRGVIIRDLSSYGLNAIRITVGTEAQNNRLFALFSEAIQ